MRLQHLKQQTLANSEVRAEYYQLENEFAFIDQLLSMRARAGLTQEQLAKRMHTQKTHAHSKNACTLKKVISAD